MRKTRWERSAWVVLLLLALVTVLVEKGKQEDRAYVSAYSYGPSGSRIFADLLRKEGLPVRVDRSVRPKVGPNDLLITAHPFGSPLTRKFVTYEGARLDNEDEEETESGDAVEEAEREPSYLESHLQQGGSCLNLIVAQEFGKATQRAAAANWKQLKGKEVFQVFQSRATELLLPVPIFEDAGSTAPRVAAMPYESGAVFEVGDAIGVTNRFIDRADNAKFYVQLVKTILPKGGKVVFAEESVGNAVDGTLLSAIGPWAQTAFQQLMLLMLVVALTLGKPFGPLIWRRREIQSKRDLMEAIGLLLFRGRKRQLALAVLQREADRRLKLLARVPQRAEISAVWPVLGPEMQSSYHAVFQSFSAGTGLASEQAVDGLFQNIRWAERNRKGTKEQ